MKIWLLTIFSLLMFCSFVSALTQVSIYVDDAGNAFFIGESNDSLKFPDGITLEDGKIGGYTSTLTKKNGDIWTFSYRLEGSELNVIFPQGAVVNELVSGNVYLIGKQIGVYSNDYVELSYTTPVQESSGQSRTVVIILLILAVIIGSYIYWRKMKPVYKEGRKPVRKKDKLTILNNVLNEREKLILIKLRETGKIKSSFLRKATQIPKASFSRHIHELEKKKLVRLSGDGKNKFVELTR